MRARRIPAAVVLIGLLWCLPAGAAGTGAAVGVARQPGAASCPGVVEIVQRLHAEGTPGARQAEPREGRFQVTFSGRPGRFAALIRSPGGHLRQLEDSSDSCDELGRATALALGLMIEEGRDETHDSTLGVSAGQRERMSPQRQIAAALSLGAGASTTLDSLLPAASLELGLAEPFDVQLRLLASAPREVRYAGGRVDLSWFAAGVHSCPDLGLTLDVRPCAGFLLARLGADASGYAGFNESVGRWVPTVELGGRLSGSFSSWFSGWMYAGALVPTTRERFRVVGASGLAHEAPSASGTLMLGLRLHFE